MKRIWDTKMEDTTIPVTIKKERKLTPDIVKYHSFLRKMTRFNPTRGGKISPTGYAIWDAVLNASFQVPSTSALLPASSTRLSAA